LLICVLFVLAGCGTMSGRGGSPTQADAPRSSPRGGAPSARGGYYLDDGPLADAPANLDEIPDAVPRLEALNRATARPYVVMGRHYAPMTELKAYRERGVATWYGRRYHGKPTSSGEPYDMYAMTAAHTTLPIPSYARVTNLANGRSVIVRVNDRGPFIGERLIDLSYVAAHKLDIVRDGSGLVEVEVVLPSSARAAEPLAARESPSANTRETFIQLGSFSTKDHAERLAQQVREQMRGMDNRVHIVADGKLHKVRVGPYAEHSALQSDLARIAIVLDITPIIIAPRP
jgi:rare lipoprotein A